MKKSEDCQHIRKTKTWQVQSNSMTSMIGAKNKKNNLLITNQTGNYSKVDGYLYPSKIQLEPLRTPPKQIDWSLTVRSPPVFVRL